MKRTLFYLALGYEKDGDPHYMLLSLSRTTRRTKLPTSFMDISPCTFGTGYGLKHIGFESFFKSEHNGTVFQVPSVLTNNSSYYCNNFSNFLRCTSVIF